MSETTWPRRLLPAAAILLALWSLVPLGIWWDNVPPAYFRDARQTWLWGSAVGALAIALLLALSKGRVAGWLLECLEGVFRQAQTGRLPRFRHPLLTKLKRGIF